MRAVNFIKNKIEFASKGNGKINVDLNFVEAFNEIINFINGVPQEENNSEDALILFYLLQIWRIDNKKNKAKISEDRRYLFEISNPYVELENLFFAVNPKENIIDEIYTELRAHQRYNKVKKEELIKQKDVSKLLNELLNDVKKGKPFQQLKAKKYEH